MRNWIILALALIFFAFSLFHASWIAPEPKGGAKLIAGKAAAPLRDSQGCAASMPLGYGEADAGPDINALAATIGNEADAVHITTIMAGGTLSVAPQFDSQCPADKSRKTGSVAAAVSILTKPQLFWRAKGASEAQQLLPLLPTAQGEDKQGLISDQAAVDLFKKARPKAWAFTVTAARACASDYRTSGLWGSIPVSCAQGTMLLSVDELGYTLWGWPNRFLARTEAAGLKIIIAESVEGDTIKGLTDVRRYSDIANSFNGHIWIDNIEELGPALKQ